MRLIPRTPRRYRTDTSRRILGEVLENRALMAADVAFLEAPVDNSTVAAEVATPIHRHSDAQLADQEALPSSGADLVESTVAMDDSLADAVLANWSSDSDAQTSHDEDDDDGSIDVDRWRIFRQHGDEVWWRDDEGNAHRGTLTGGGDSGSTKVLPDCHGGFISMPGEDPFVLY